MRLVLRPACRVTGEFGDTRGCPRVEWVLSQVSHHANPRSLIVESAVVNRVGIERVKGFSQQMPERTGIVLSPTRDTALLQLPRIIRPIQPRWLLPFILTRLTRPNKNILSEIMLAIFYQ